MWPLSQTMASRLALKPRAALIMFQMWIALWWWCTQITINPGRSLQLPAEAALLCKDWLLQYVMRRSWARSSSNRERESCRRHPRSNVVFGERWHARFFLLTPLCPLSVLLAKEGITNTPFNHCGPVFVEPIWTSALSQSIFSSVIIAARSSSSIFCPKTDNTRNNAGAALPPLWPGVSICKRQLISTYVPCVFNKSTWSTWNPIQIIAEHVNYTYFALYQTPPPPNSTHLSAERNWIFC